MPLLNSCCGCFTLRTGTILSGVLGIVSALITLIIMLATKVKLKTIVLDNLSPLIVKIIISINLTMTILISILLIIGAVKKVIPKKKSAYLKRKRWFMLPWVVLSIILAIGMAISVIYTTVEFYLNKDVLSGTLGLVTGLFIVVITVYLWLVVLSYYQLIKEEKNRGPYGRPLYSHGR